jgi:hypothetical protein
MNACAALASPQLQPISMEVTQDMSGFEISSQTDRRGCASAASCLAQQTNRSSVSIRKRISSAHGVCHRDDLRRPGRNARLCGARKLRGRTRHSTIGHLGIAPASYHEKEDILIAATLGGAEWNSPAYDPKTNLVLIGEVDWCDTATPKDLNQQRKVEGARPWAGIVLHVWQRRSHGGTLGWMCLCRRS